MEGGHHFAVVKRLVGGEIPIPPDTVSANMIGRVISAAVARGASRPILLEALGISESTIRNQLARVPGQTLNRLLTAIESHLGNPAVTLEIGRDSRPSCFSDLGFATRLLPTLFEIIQENVLMQELRQSMYRVALADTGTEVILSWNLMGHSAESLSAAVDFSITTYSRLAKEIYGDATQIKKITAQHAPRFDPAKYQRIIGHPIEFGAPQTAIHFSSSQCHAPSPFANETLLHAAHKAHASKLGWLEMGKRHSAFTYFYVWTELNKSPVTLDRIARSFGMAERTLRRHLVDEGNPFRSIVDEARRQMCDLYRIEGKRSLGEVAELLGYGELSAFTRAYRRWYGQPPSRNWQAPSPF